MSSQLLQPLSFPLHGSRLIEASAGTGKTWTIAALYVRLVLGHGGAQGFTRPLLPADILVMTFTRAATRELSNRVRQRLVEAAAYFRGEASRGDDYLDALLESYPDYSERQKAAHRLMLAAETMDEAAIFTIDAWCQRMLREHAFDSGSLFDEELVSDEQALFEDAAHDYWRQQVYPLNAVALEALLACWNDVGVLKKTIRELARRAASLDTGADEALGALIGRVQAEQQARLAQLKQGWLERADRMEQWIARQRELSPKCFNGTKMKPESLLKWFDGLRAWAGQPHLVRPDISDTAWRRLTPDGIADAYARNFTAEVPDDFDATAALAAALAQIQPLAHALYRHAAGKIAARIEELKRRARQFGFADMLLRLQAALQGENGAALRQRIVDQYPLVMVDEFQDTAPGQYRIFDLLYRVAGNDPALGLFLIGDPKQSIYGFRGADIQSYLAARRATAGRHYQLGTNYRSTEPLVAAVNQLFLHAEGSEHFAGFTAGAFRYRNERENPLPFEAVRAKGRGDRLVTGDGPLPALSVTLASDENLKGDGYRDYFAQHCAEHIVALLNDPLAGFDGQNGLVRLQPADIAVLVRDRREAAAIRRALQQRKVASVYLSDKDSVIDSEEAADVLRWLHALANPLDGALARAAFATRTIGLPLAALAALSSNELEWEQRVEQLKGLHLVWQRQGVLAMLRRFIHELKLPSALLRQPGGERRLTNLLHLAELLQSASRQLDGEQALIRWLAEQIAGGGDGQGDSGERVLRLESDAELVKVVTVHKSKGLEYPLVYLPFAVTARKAERRNRSFFEYTDGDGVRQIDMALSDDALEAVEAARIEEDLRLLYVALTRARHYLWLGVAALASRKAGDNVLHESALGYLLAGGEKLPAAELLPRWQRLRQVCGDIAIAVAGQPEKMTPLKRLELRPALGDAALFGGRFERDWTVGSFTSLTRQIGAANAHVPQLARDETLLEDDDSTEAMRTDDAPWHRFPRGSVPGNFLHEQLEWMGQEGFAIIHDDTFDSRLAARCERAGWGHRQDDTIIWLRAVAETPLPLLGAALCEIASLLPEMEFWFPSERLNTAALDQLCSAHLLGETPRPALPRRQLHGMLKGYADLVIERDGRYWVLDYKSNFLGTGDGAYHRQALANGMAQHRYDIQGAVYLLALHRLLRSRLGDSYDPQQHLGGALFLFLRGIANPHTHGCYWLAPDTALLDGLDRLLDEPHHED
ncbi:exodeoxyribonuclease V subunit beta [Janthinobacterium agaricidamnosum]|uniref:RecBCD enzyme subunit RecB n=1 Tax=Janthinobacterium agaricidamnosum NBRC 102515 = DSM 9628 TaxID=1349767 RepID=W0V5I9_9BURK|nr:exodeoxyribonuclease V subunit beta [Janthinobacterium agaricidamnosum]CDG82517.1 exodeoxyribonuclease V, beta subunit [Janthinobacterium agaricidamnosum NBRC 102515 = DSM 9628]